MDRDRDRRRGARERRPQAFFWRLGGVSTQAL